jgi:hypothetical protein
LTIGPIRTKNTHQLPDSNDSMIPPEDISRLQKLSRESKNFSLESMRLPLPRRFRMEVTQNCLKVMLGNLLVTIDVLLSEGDTSASIARVLIEGTEYGSWLRDRSFSRVSLEQLLQMRRFQNQGGRILTYRYSLCLKLDDMDIGSRVPMSFMRPPFPVCYIEFGPAEERGALSYKVLIKDEAWFPLEGAYITYHSDSDGSTLSKRGREVLGIEPDKPIQCLELTFTGSPLGMDKNDRSIMADMAIYISLYWTDPDQTIEETLKRHFILLRERDGLSQGSQESLEANVRRLSKALLYLITGNREQAVESQESDLARRLAAGKNPAKSRKVLSQLRRSYDRVIIGPNRPYIPLEDRLSGIRRRTGVRPHFRRAHWSTRWSGPKRAILKPVQIDLTLVNAEGLSDEDMSYLQRDYDVM